MSKRIHLDATFRSYAEFKTAFDEYCRENAIGGVPLTYIRHTSKKLKVNTFKDDPIDPDVVNRIVYNNLSLRCVHHEAITTNEIGPHCTGRITLLYIRLTNKLKVTTLDGHFNHPVVASSSSSSHDENTKENSRLSDILKIARELPNDALALLEQVCKGIRDNWGDENAAGLTVNIVPIESESQVIAQIKQELQQSALNEDTNEKKIVASPPVPQKIERFRKLRLKRLVQTRIDDPSVWKDQKHPVKMLKNIKIAKVVKPEPIVHQPMVKPAKKVQKRKSHHKSPPNSGTLAQLREQLRDENVFEDFENENPPKKLKSENQS